MEPFVTYPTSLKPAAALYFAPVLRGSWPDDTNKAINAGQHIQLWLCGRTWPVGDIASAAVPTIQSEAQVADWLEAKAAGAPEVQGWESILPIVMPYILDAIKRLLERRRNLPKPAGEPEVNV